MDLTFSAECLLRKTCHDTQTRREGEKPHCRPKPPQQYRFQATTYKSIHKVKLNQNWRVPHQLQGTFSSEIYWRGPHKDQEEADQQMKALPFFSTHNTVMSSKRKHGAGVPCCCLVAGDAPVVLASSSLKGTPNRLGRVWSEMSCLLTLCWQCWCYTGLLGRPGDN